MNAQLKADLENARQCLLETYHLAMTYGTPGKLKRNHILQLHVYFYILSLSSQTPKIRRNILI